MDVRAALGDRIKHYRRLKNLSQDTLASAMDVDKHTVWRWENGKSWPEYDKLIAIAAALEVQTERLFETIGKTAPVERSPTLSSLMDIIKSQEDTLRSHAYAMDVYNRIKNHPVLRQLWTLSDEKLQSIANRVGLMTGSDEEDDNELEAPDTGKGEGDI